MDLIWVRVVLYCPSNSDPEAISFNESILCACLELDRRFRRLQKWWEPKVSTIWNFSSNSWYWGTNPINLKIRQFHRLLCGNSSSQRYPDLPLHWPDDAQQPQRDLAQKLSFCGTCLAGKGFRMICPQACGANLTLASCWWKANLPCWDERQSSTMPGSTFSCLLEYGREKICCS